MATVPSNLIPTRITQLPDAPVASEDTLLIGVYQGNTYKIRAGDLLQVAGVPLSRQVIAGTGLTGGGQLSSNVTLSVAPGGIGTTQLAASGVTPGSYGSGASIPVLTVDATGRVMAATSIPLEVTGYVPDTRQVIAGDGLTGGGPLSSNVTLAANLSNTTPLVVDDTGAPGVSLEVSRADHQHPAVDLSDAQQINGILPLDQGGTARSLVPDEGAIIWCGADGLYVGPVGESGQVLISNGTGEYTWGSALVVTPQAANTFFAGPTAGGAADPLFRAMVNADLPNSGATPGSYGSVTAIPVLTVNAKGVITSITSTAFTGGLEYKGNWNAATNTPTLTSSVGTNGNYYTVSVAGTTNLNGITDWQVGDWAIFNGAEWQKIDQSNTVTSVNGEVGAVILDYADVGAPSTTGVNATGSWGIDITGNAATVTDGVYTDGSYADPAWITSLAGSKITGDISGNAGNVNGIVAIANGGTGSSTAAGAPFALKGGNTDITSMTGLTGGISSPDYVQFDTAATPTQAVGRLQWDAGEGTLQFGLAGGNVNLQIGMENVAYVKNDDTVTLTDGMVVYISGANGTNLLVKRAQATSDGLSATTLGVVTETIATNGLGYITTFGNVNGLNTTAFAAGDILYLSPTTAGALTNVKPVAPQHLVTVAVCTKVSAGNGQIFVRVDNGYELDELHNVKITSQAAYNLLQVDPTNTYWQNVAGPTSAVVGVSDSQTLTNKTISGSTNTLSNIGNASLTYSSVTFNGTTVSLGGSGTITAVNPFALTIGSGLTGTSYDGSAGVTITNAAPDQVVTLTQGGTTTITGTYPNFTISSADQYVGTVTSVSGTGSVSGITLSGTVTSSGSLTLGGALDLSSPPAIGGTTPAAITGTIVTATTRFVGVNGGTF